tara:strand:+ start:438 stop:569 length:132 start_codon:yes stop_codon:yes gene_type:complete
MAAHAVLAAVLHFVIVGIIVMAVKGTLVSTYLTFDALLYVSFH